MDSRNTGNMIKEIAEEGGKIVAVGTMVAAGLLPLDWLMHRKHTQSSSTNQSASTNKSSTARLSVLFAMGKQIAQSAANTIFTTYPQSVKAATVKNSIITQRDNVGEAISGKSEVTEEKDKSFVPSLTLAQSASVAGIIGGTDTVLTQYYSNLKVLGFEAAENKNFVMPNIQSMHDKQKIYVAGLFSRAAKNSMVMSGFVINPLIAQQLQALLPHSDYIDIPKWMATMMGGATTGAIGNAADIVYKNQVIRIDPKTLMTPSAYQIVTDLIAKEGIYAALTRGWRPAMLYSIAAQAIVPKAEEIAEKIVPLLFYKANNFFQSIHQLPVENEIEEDIRMCSVRS